MATELMQDSDLQNKTTKTTAASAKTASQSEPSAEAVKAKAPKRAATIKRKRKKKVAPKTTETVAEDAGDAKETPKSGADTNDQAAEKTPPRKKATRRRKKATRASAKSKAAESATDTIASSDGDAVDGPSGETGSQKATASKTVPTDSAGDSDVLNTGVEATAGNAESTTATSSAKSDGPPKRRRRRSGGRKKAAARTAATETETESPHADTEVVAEADSPSDKADQPAERPSSEIESTGTKSAPDTESREPAAKQRQGRRRRRRSGKSADGDSARQASPAASPATKSSATEASKSPSKPAPARFEFDDDTDDGDDDGPAGTGDRTMVINAASDDECRVAVLHEGKLEELFMERTSAESHVNSIFKGRVTNVEPSIQAVFIDFGQAKNGFLHISDVHPHYFPNGKGRSEDVGKKIPRRDRPPIQKCFRRGQEVVVQVIKEGVGTKGPTLTTYLSIPGRFLVMMPGMSRVGVSRKIEDEEQRRSMREVLDQLELPDGMGFILRTAGLGQNKRELQRDLNYLQRLWKRIADRIRKEKAPCEVYRESDLVIRSIRDVFSTDFKNIIVDDEETAQKASEFLKIAMPRSGDLVELYQEEEPLFHKYGIEEEIERINARHVPLPLGGSIVIESTEAMVAIDVNSGRFRTVDDAEESALRINMQAAEEIARQLRLRDLGGLIVCDFIDMRLERNKRAVERCLRNALRKHKERARILRMSAFGLIEITRQRQRPSIRKSMYGECPHCRGSGLIKSPESMALEALRTIQVAAHREGVKRIVLVVAAQVANMVQNQKRRNLCEIEERAGTSIVVRADFSYATDQMTCELEDALGRPLPMPPPR